MIRFRPNIVIEADEPWVEDSWARHSHRRSGRFALLRRAAAARCRRASPWTGEQNDPREPLQTLAGFHRSDYGGVVFGQNAIPEGVGTISVGDTVEVLESGASRT